VHGSDDHTAIGPEYENELASYGDDAALALGWTPLGLGARVGLSHCSAAASVAIGNCDIADLLRSRWSVP
jgi:hypothetical protein